MEIKDEKKHHGGVDKPLSIRKSDMIVFVV